MSKDDFLLGEDDDDFVPRPPHPERFEELLDRLAEIQAVRMLEPETPLYRMGRYELVQLIGEGGMSLVFAAIDTELNRKVALKLWAIPGPNLAAKVIHEAKLLARLAHPNVVTIHDVGRWGDDAFIVMELVTGENADKWAMRLPAPTWREVLDVYVAAGHGLAEAHDKQILHGDVKPSNILIGADGRVRVADFGLAELLREHEAEELEREAADVGVELPPRRPGTLVYMAPERLKGRRGDARADQYSYCASMWEALYAAVPFAGETREKLLASIDEGQLQTGQWALPDVPPRLQKLLRVGLARDPEERHADMATLVGKLRDLPEDRRKRNIFFYALLAVFACVALGALGTAIWMRPAELPVPAPASEATVEDRVVELIERREYKQADELWSTEVDLRMDYDEAVAADSLRIGRLFLEHARALEAENSAIYSDVAEYAANAGSFAQADLLDDGAPTKQADQLISDASELAGLELQSSEGP